MGAPLGGRKVPNGVLNLLGGIPTIAAAVVRMGLSTNLRAESNLAHGIPAEEPFRASPTYRFLLGNTGP